jgi:hypothetical protein
MTTETATDTATTLTAAEKRALRTIRNRYREDRDIFSERELTKLRFIKWLVQNGRLDS